MTISKQDVERWKLPTAFEGLKIKLKYERQGGVVVCENCRRFLGFPKKNRDGIITRKPQKAFCPSCGGRGRVIHAERTGDTFGYLTTPDGKTLTARARLSCEDYFNGKVAREIITGRLLRQAHDIYHPKPTPPAEQPTEGTTRKW